MARWAWGAAMVGIASAAALAALLLRRRSDVAPAAQGYTLGPNAILSPWAEELLGALVAAGAPAMYVTSALRQPADQARAMAGRIRDYGAQSVLDLYRADVSAVVDAYPDLEAMTEAVEAIGSQISRHLGAGEAVDIIPVPGSGVDVETLRAQISAVLPAGYRILDESGVVHIQAA